jgi:hypothetical protein
MTISHQVQLLTKLSQTNFIVGSKSKHNAYIIDIKKCACMNNLNLVIILSWSW